MPIFHSVGCRVLTAYIVLAFVSVIELHSKASSVLRTQESQCAFKVARKRAGNVSIQSKHGNRIPFDVLVPMTYPVY